MEPKDQQQEQDRASSAERRDDITVKGPFGWEIRANGKEVKGLLLGSLAVLALAAMLRDHHSDSMEKIAQNDAHSVARAHEILSRLTTVAERLEETGYILTLTEEERKALHYSMPDSLRKRIRTTREDYR